MKSKSILVLAVTIALIGIVAIVVLVNQQKTRTSTSTRTTTSRIRTQSKPDKVITNSIGMKLVYIPAGEFMMGSRDSASEVAQKSKGKEEWYTDEHPQHKVRISKGFYMGVYEVIDEPKPRVILLCESPRDV